MIKESKSLFISSTFRDMQSERDVLRDVVLPRVNAFASQYGEQVELIDLRWGVDTAGIDEREQSQKVLRTCLDEIERSRPFFIGLLGDRYGWVPPERDMKDALDFVDYRAETMEQSVTALEIEYGALRSPKPPVCLFYFRHIEDYSPLGEEAVPVYKDTGEASKKLTALKERIKTKFDSNVKEYDAIIEDGEVAGLADFAKMVADDIIASLREEWGDPPKEPPNEYEREMMALDQFRRSKTTAFIGCESIIKKLLDFCLGENSDDVYGDVGGYYANRIMLLQGEAGSGKSALLCRVMDELAKHESDGALILLPFSCSITPRSSHVEGMLCSWIYHLEKVLLRESGMELAGFLKLKDRFYELVNLAGDTPVVVVADAIDKLRGGDETRNMLWITGKLPDNFTMLCSMTEGAYIEPIRDLGGVVISKPPLDNFDIIEIIHAAAKRHHKQMSGDVVNYILDRTTADGKQAAQNPLYINLLLDGLAMINRFEHAIIDKYALDNKDSGITPMDAINHFMKKRIDETPSDAQGAFLEIAERINNLIGEDFAIDVLCMVAASRSGLRESDLEGAFEEIGKPFVSADFSWLRQLLNGHFVQGGTLQWNFAYECMRSSLLTRCKQKVYELNNHIADYFMKPDNRNDEFINREILHHLCLANRPDAAAAFISGGETQFAVCHHENLAAVYRENENGADFLSDILEEAAKMTDGTGWRVCRLYGHLKRTLPYGTPTEYIWGLIMRAVSITESIADMSDEASYYLYDLYISAAISSSDETGTVSKAAVSYFRKAVDARKNHYANKNDIDSLVGVVHAQNMMAGAIRNAPGFDDEYRYLVEQLREYVRLLTQKVDLSEEQFHAWLNISEGHLHCIYAQMQDTSATIKQMKKSISEYISMNEGLREVYKGRNLPILKNLSIAYGLLGDIHKGQDDFSGVSEHYMKRIDLAEEVFERTGEIRDKMLIADAYYDCGVGCIELKLFGTAEDMLGRALQYYTQLFSYNPKVSTVLSIIDTLGYLAPLCSNSGRQDDAAQYAIWSYAMTCALCERGDIDETDSKMSYGQRLVRMYPPADDEDGSKMQSMFTEAFGLVINTLPTLQDLLP